MNRLGEQVATPGPVLSGTFKSFPLDQILAVLALSRQTVRVRFTDEGREVGTIAVKAGQVIGAEDFRTRTYGADALHGLASDPGTAFAVVALSRDEPEARATTAIGNLGELLRDARDRCGNDPSGPSSPDDDLQRGDIILRGDISDISFDEILEALPLSNLHVLVSFSRDGLPIGTLNLMSGEVLAATAGPLRGTEAFNQLHADHGEMFEVHRLEAPDETASLGSVATLLAGVRENTPARPERPRKGLRGERALFMQGRFSDFPLDVLLDSLEFCRQTIELEFRREEVILHRVLVKAGRIAAAVSAAAQDTDAALAAIREDPGSQFYVFQRQGAVGQSIAGVDALISDTSSIAGKVQALSTSLTSPLGTPTSSPCGNGGPEALDLSGITAQLKRLASDVAALRAAGQTLRQDPERAKLVDVLSRIAAVHRKLRYTLEQSHRKVIEEVRISREAPSSDRQARTLLWGILAVQLGTLAAVVGLVFLHM